MMPSTSTGAVDQCLSENRVGPKASQNSSCSCQGFMLVSESPGLRRLEDKCLRHPESVGDNPINHYCVKFTAKREVLANGPLIREMEPPTNPIGPWIQKGTQGIEIPSVWQRCDDNYD